MIKLFTRGTLIIPIAICFIFFFSYFAVGNFFVSLVWLSLLGFCSLIFLPIIINMDDKNVPVTQIFIGAIFFLLLFCTAAFYDFLQANVPTAEAVFFGICVGLLIIGVVILINGRYK